MLYLNNKEKKFVDKSIKNSLSRKSIYFRRNLHINGKETNFKVIKITDNLNEMIGGIVDQDFNCVFLLEHTSQIEIKNIKTNFDIVGTDYKNRVLIKEKILNNVDNKIDWTSIEIKNIWIFKENFCTHLNIKNNSILSTKKII